MKIIYDKNKCMGCGLCSNLDPENFGYEEGKATLVNGTEKSAGIFEKAIEEAKEETKTAAEACPVMAIEIK